MNSLEKIKNRVGNQCIIKSYEFGFRAFDDGTIISNKGKAVGSVGPDGRVRFAGVCSDDGKKHRSILTHRFIAYQLYGDKIFEPGVVVRHLNDDPGDNRFENISLGTRKQNAKDAKENNIKLGCAGKYSGQYGKIYRYYRINGWSNTMRDLGVSFRMLSYVRNKYTPTLTDKFRIWLAK